MKTSNDREWADIRRLIENDKAGAWAEMDSHVHPAPSSASSRRRFYPRLAAAAVVLLAIVGLIFLSRPGNDPVTIDQLPFFASAGKSIAHGEPSPREREMGRRLAGWITLVNREASPSVPSAEISNDKDIKNRETMLERLFLESTQHQEV